MEIHGPRRKNVSKRRSNLARFGVVVGDGVDGVHGGGWAENGGDGWRQGWAELLFFSRFWTRINVKSLNFETARRLAKGRWRLASSEHNPDRRLTETKAKSLVIVGLPNEAEGIFPRG
jgi:hypothetical protein